jgi:hypothetical protein
VHPRGLGAESRLATSIEIRAEGDAEATRDGVVWEETVAGGGVVGSGGGVEGRGKSLPMREVDEAEDGLRD